MKEAITMQAKVPAGAVCVAAKTAFVAWQNPQQTVVQQNLNVLVVRIRGG